MRITNIDERHFYEIEAVKNDWNLQENEIAGRKSDDWNYSL